MQTIDQILDNVLEDKEIKKFCSDYGFKREFLKNSLPTLLTQCERNKICRDCKGKKVCNQDMTDFHSTLFYYNGKIDFNYQKCPYKEILNEDFVELLFVPENNYVTNLDMYKVDARASIYRRLNEFVKQYKDGNVGKGMYVHGSFGVGKTFIMLKLANALASNGIKVLFVYYPDLVRSLKSSIGTNSIEKYIEKLKRAEILILDDFGAESNSSFIRDEVLGPVLQYRMNENKPLFISSNLNISLLREHLEETKNENNAINSSRIIERITALTDCYELKDKNYRVK